MYAYVHLASNNAKLEDHQRTLSSYNVTNGSTLMMIILDRFVLYVTGLDLTLHEVEIPSCDPEVRSNLYVIFLNQVCTGLWPAHDWFLEIAFVCDVCVCVSTPEAISN